MLKSKCMPKLTVLFSSPSPRISTQTLSALSTSLSLSSASTSFLYVACLYMAFFHALRTLWFFVTRPIPGDCWMSAIWSRSTFSRSAMCSHLGMKKHTSLMWSSDIILSNCWSVTAYFNAMADMVSIPIAKTRSHVMESVISGLTGLEWTEMTFDLSNAY